MLERLYWVWKKSGGNFCFQNKNRSHPPASPLFLLFFVALTPRMVTVRSKVITICRYGRYKFNHFLPSIIVGIYSDAASWWAGWVLAHLEFGSSVNPITTRLADYAQCITALVASLNYKYHGRINVNF